MGSSCKASKSRLLCQTRRQLIRVLLTGSYIRRYRQVANLGILSLTPETAAVSILYL